MQALLYAPHIVANIFAFYSLSTKRFYTIIRNYFGGIGENPQLNENMIIAVRMWAEFVRNKYNSAEKYTNICADYYGPSVDDMVTDELLSKIAVLKLHIYPHALWWPGATKIRPNFTYGPAPAKRSEIRTLKRYNIHQFLKSNPRRQNNLVDLECDVDDCSSFRIKRVKGGAPILPKIRGNSIDFRNIAGIIKLCVYGFERVYAPTDTSALKSITICSVNEIITEEPFNNVHSINVEYPRGLELLTPLVPNLEMLTICGDGVRMVNIKSPRITHIDARDFKNINVDCPRLEYLRWDVYNPKPSQMSEFFRDWYFDYDKCMRFKPSKYK